jgi:hypothetical protein
MRQIERDADTRDTIGRAPLVTQPRVKTEAPEPRRIELFMQALHTVFEPRAGDCETELTQANIEELLGR